MTQTPVRAREKELYIIQSLANLVAIVTVELFVKFRGRDRWVEAVRPARWLRIAEVIPLGLQLAFYLVISIGETISGDLSSAGQLVLAAVILLLCILAWLRPLEGGAALIAITASMIVVATTSVLEPSRPASSLLSPMINLVAAPQIISGVLFQSAGLLARRANAVHSV